MHLDAATQQCCWYLIQSMPYFHNRERILWLDKITTYTSSDTSASQRVAYLRAALAKKLLLVVSLVTIISPWRRCSPDLIPLALPLQPINIQYRISTLNVYKEKT